MSDPKPTEGKVVTARTFGDAQNQLGGWRNKVTKQIKPIETAKLDVAKQITPGYNTLQNQEYKRVAPNLATTGAKVDEISRSGAANADVNILNNTGQQLASGVRAADQTLNPEFHAARTQAGGKLGELLGSINLNDANPEAERLVSQEAARSGTLGNPANATNTVANALSFGKELDARRTSLGNAIGTATNFMPQSRAGFDPVANALTRGPTNTGENKFLGVQRPGQEAFDTGQSVLDVSAGVQTQKQDLKANRRQFDTRVNEAIGSC